MVAQPVVPQSHGLVLVLLEALVLAPADTGKGHEAVAIIILEWPLMMGAGNLSAFSLTYIRLRPNPACTPDPVRTGHLPSLESWEEQMTLSSAGPQVKPRLHQCALLASQETSSVTRGGIAGYPSESRQARGSHRHRCSTCKRSSIVLVYANLDHGS